MIQKVFIIPLKEWHQNHPSPQDNEGHKVPVVTIEYGERNGEMALIPTIKVKHDGYLFCEIDASQCVVYFN